MTQHRVTDEQYGKFCRRIDDLSRRIKEGSIPYEPTFNLLQKISEGSLHEIFELPNSWAISPFEQLEIARKRNRDYGWGFTQEEFRLLEKTVPLPFALPKREDTVIILDISLDTIQETFEEAWRCRIEKVLLHPWNRDRETTRTDKEHLRLITGKHHIRGMRWKRVDLTSNWGAGEWLAKNQDERPGGSFSPKSVRSPKKSPSSEILWAASYFPEWIELMYQQEMPNVWLPGYEFHVPEEESKEGAWAHTPYLSEFSVSNLMHLGFGRTKQTYHFWAIPEYVDAD